MALSMLSAVDQMTPTQGVGGLWAHPPLASGGHEVMVDSCLCESGLDQQAALLHIARALYPLAERAEELTP